MKVPLMRDTFLQDEATRRQLAEFIKSAPRLSMGEMCAKFEAQFATWQGRRYAVLVNSGSSANLALIQALLNLGRLKRGDRVAVSALTWATNVMPIIQLGFVPAVMDVDPETLFTNPEVDWHMVFPTHALGFSAFPGHSGDDILRRRHLIEDCCEALGVELRDGRLGNFGLASTFSFYVGHHLSTIEGGMVCTDDPDLRDMLLRVRAHGWERNVPGYREADFHSSYTFHVPGFNIRPTEITGFLGLLQLPLMDQAITKREAIYTRLAEARSANPDFLRHDRRHIKRLSAFCFPMVCHTPALRAQYVAAFKIAGVEVRPLLAGNIQRHPFWKKAGLPQYATPGADMLHDCGFYCAIRPDMTEEELTTIEGCLA